MQADILGTFFHRLLPRYNPRAEAMLRRTTSNDLQRLNFRYIFTVDGMIDISHMIEDLITSNPGVSETHVSFQYFSRITPQEKRYQGVAEASRNLFLYGISDMPLPAFPNTTGIDTTNTPLENYWFVIAYGPGLSATLLAEEISPIDRLPNEPRIYEGFYTFETDTAFQVLVVLHQLYPEQVSKPTPPELFG